MVTGLFVTQNWDVPQPFWSIALHLCITLPREGSCEWEQQASSPAAIIYSPFSCRTWGKKKNVAVASARGTIVRDKSKGSPSPAVAGHSHREPSGEDLAPGYFIPDSLQPAPCVPLTKGETVFLCQARQLLLSSCMAFSQLSTALSSKQDSVRKFMSQV